MSKITASHVANKIRSCDYNSTLEQIRNKTDWLKQSCSVIIDEDKQVFGVISEADILEAEKNHLNLKAIHAWEICSHKIISIEGEKDINEVIELMLNYNIHHILVKNKINEKKI